MLNVTAETMDGNKFVNPPNVAITLNVYSIKYVEIYAFFIVLALYSSKLYLKQGL